MITDEEFEQRIVEFADAPGMSIIDTADSKCCSICGEIKHRSKFYVVKRKGRKALDSLCKQCKSDIHKLYYIKNAETIKKQFSTYYKNNKVKHRLTCAKWYYKNKRLRND